MRSLGHSIGKPLLFVLFVFLVVALSGCTNSGGVENGTITGKLMIMGNDGMPSNQVLPDITVRADAYNSADNSFSRTSIVDSSTGEYVIGDLPVGIYALRFIAPPYSDGFAYILQVNDGYPATSGGTIPNTGAAAGGGNANKQVARDDEAPAVPEASFKITDSSSTTVQTTGNVMGSSNAIVESGKTYEMPTIYLVKSDTIPKVGSVRGTVINVFTQQPVDGATVSLTDSQNTLYTTVTNSEGVFNITEVFPGSGTIKTEKSGLIFIADGDEDHVGQDQNIIIPENRRVEVELYMTPGKATLAGVIDTEFSLEAADWERIHIAVDGVALREEDITGTLPNFNIKVPSGMNSYVVRIFGDIVQPDSSNVVVGPLRVGSVNPVTGLAAVLKTATVNVKVVASSPNGLTPEKGQMLSVSTDKGQHTDVTFPGNSSMTAPSELSKVPYGKRKFKTRGATLIKKTREVQNNQAVYTFFSDIDEEIEIFGDVTITLVLQ
ncbi:MAG: hypothetical protein CVV64_01695 [Candidatus Wallbacteria bacterium HGW-Wallbacteria-1]|jgi:hypothetical protein|uniref:Carboxypeptidase regulatory-like domain-containing protein n=1 Tax=Candidatus Wallbacteria bacterium HGW-Wallbacteria-1 TaxID=2013854 RepID=A0A2N1PUY6_9BACT|nr:MAG: hypothetical protein CVV64_01695 [Candidatus Wallbacteria bacterium HGW-Wallbacteria-1]